MPYVFWNMRHQEDCEPGIQLGYSTSEMDSIISKMSPCSFTLHYKQNNHNPFKLDGIDDRVELIN